MIILSTPDCLRNRGNSNINRRSTSPLHSAHLDGTTATITNAKNVIMAAAVDNGHPLFIDNNDEDARMTNASHARTTSSPRTKGIFTDSVTLPTIQITRPNLPDSETFSWSDFPLLTESLGYNDPGWQPHKAAGIRLKEQQKSRSGKRIRLQENYVENELFPSDLSNSLKVTSSTKPALRKISGSQHKISNTTLRKRTNSNKSIRNVRFDAVHIREHSVTLGDHDWCEGSLAISLDWPHVATPKSMLMTDYESMRERQGRVPRGRLPKLEYWQRKHLLQRVGGMTDEELQAIEHLEQDYHRFNYSGLPRTMTVPSIAAT